MKKLDQIFAWLLVAGGLLHGVRVLLEWGAPFHSTQELIWYLEAGLGLAVVGVLNLLRFWSPSGAAQAAALISNLLLLAVTFYGTWVVPDLGSVVILAVALGESVFSLAGLGRSAVRRRRD